MATTGLYEDGGQGVRRVTDSALRLRDMDRRIYNDWLADFCKHAPDRFIGLACLPYGDIDAAVKELHRVARRSATWGSG